MKRDGKGAAGALLLCFIFAAGLPSGAGAQEKGATEPNPQERVLFANLYVQVAAEYQAVCAQIYGWAGERLRQRLAVRPRDGRPPAVVMDLDETVFDNAGYQSYLDREKRDFSPATWETWERDHAAEVRLVPGAKPFIDLAESMGVAVVYLSNRLDKTRAGTVEALRHLGLGLAGIDDRLLLNTGSSDKGERRRLAAERYDVLMLVGDNLRDFSDEFTLPAPPAQDEEAQKRTLEERKIRAGRAAHHWGNDWIILPNPVYGDWDRLLGANPRGKLRQTQMK